MAITLALLFMATPARADDPFTWPTDIVVHTNQQAVVVSADATGTIPGSGSGSARGSGCWLDPVTNIGQAFYDSFQQQLSGGLSPFFLWCNKDMRGLVWLDLSGGNPAPAVDPQAIAMHLRDEIPVPRAEIGINPDRGLVGVESWFWIEGYDGSPIDESVNAFGRRVEVRAHVARYEWSFGDGSTVAATTRGLAYPERSEIRHVYQRSSAGYPSGYRIEVTFVFDVRYRVGGGQWIELPGISRFAGTDYPVRESQALIQQ